MKLSRRSLFKISAITTTFILQGSRSILAQQPTLITKAIPSTRHQLPVIGIGARNYRIGKGWSTNTQEFLKTLEVFHRLGGRLIDTSPNYGNSEIVIGKLIADLGLRKDLFLATKVDKKDDSSSTARMEDSMRHLHTNHIELMQVHNLISWKQQLPLLREWKHKGRISHLGITTSNSRQYNEMEQIIKQEPIDFIQIDYAVDNRLASNRILPLAADLGIAVLINLPFGRGRLFNRVKGLDLPDWAIEIDCQSWAQFFLKYVVSEPAVTVAIPGTTKPHHAIDNLGAALGKMPDDLFRKRMENFIDRLPT